MNRIALSVLAPGLLLAVVHWSWTAEPIAKPETATAEIQRLGGTVVVDENSPGRPVISVDFK